MKNKRAFDQWAVAKPNLRLWAQIVDQALIATLLQTVLHLLFSGKMRTGEGWLLFLTLWPLISLVYQSLALYLWHTTLGKKFLNLYVTSADPDKELKAWQILVRQTLWWIGALTLGMGWASILSRRDRRAWHDVAAETVVINTKNNEPAILNPLAEKIVARIWMVAGSLTVICAITVTGYFQYNKLLRLEFIKLISLENAAWLLWIDKFDDHVVLIKSKDDSILADQLKFFQIARRIPSEKRYSYYKTQMEPVMNEFCKKNQNQEDNHEKMCLNLQILGTLLRESSDTNLVVDEIALSALKMMLEGAILRNKEGTKKELDFYEGALDGLSPHSLSYLTLKIHLMKKRMQLGQFESAAVLSNREKPSRTNTNDGNLQLRIELENLSCQAQAFAHCNFQNASYCVEETYWNDWNKGCNSSEEEMLGEKGDKSDAQKIAHVWKSILNGSESEETWEKVKKSLNDSEHNLSKQITQALDLYFATKNDSPLTVLKVSNNLSTDNILWGWAQSAAIKRYGDTWTGILPLESRNHAESLDLNEENIEVKPKIKKRELATVKKKRVSNTKSKKTNSKKSSKSKS